MKKIILFALAIIAAMSCTRDNAPSAVLTVSTEKTEYKAGEPVTFKFSGKPDNIVFYSGEYGHNFDDRHTYGRTGTMFFNFKSYVRNAVIARNIKVLMSTDFNGKYDLENIEAATWIDMSDEFTFSDQNGNKDNTESGELNINGFMADKGGLDADSRIYFAFHYFDYQDDERAAQNEWIIRASNLRLESPDGTNSDVAELKTFGWTGVTSVEGGKVDVTASRILFKDLDKTRPSESNDWTVSKAYSLGGIPADTGVAIKSISTDLDEYTYIYEKPGTYKAVFESSSYWYTGGSSSVYELEIVVTE